MTTVPQAVETTKGRYYPWDGVKYISVTTGIQEGIPKHGLNQWFIKDMADIAAKNRKKLAEMTQVQAKEFLMLKRAESRKSSVAAELGSVVHGMCQKISLGLDVEDTEETRPYTDAYRAFLIKHKPVILETEVTVYSREHGYAGTADAFMQIRKKSYVVDYKTGKSIWPEGALQLSAYRHADFIGRAGGREDPIPTCNGGLILHLRPNGYRVIPMSCGPDVFDTFLSALDIFKWNAMYGQASIGEEW